MKNSKILIFLFSALIIFGLLGCSTTSDSVTDAFKHYTATQIFQEGEKALAKGNYTDVIKHFEALDALYPFAPEAKQAKIDIIYAYYKNADYISASAAADRYIHLYPRDKYVAYAYYMKGVTDLDSSRTVVQKLYNTDVAQLDMKGMRSAFNTFNELVQQFPDSIYAKDAYRRMVYIRNNLAEHELQIANFYFEHAAYVAAINRALYIVKHLNNSPQVKDALKLMRKSYIALGEQEKANDMTRVLKLNEN